MHKGGLRPRRKVLRRNEKRPCTRSLEVSECSEKKEKGTKMLSEDTKQSPAQQSLSPEKGDDAAFTLG